MATKKTTGSKLADMIYGNPDGAAFGVFPQAGKRGQAKPTAKQQLAQIFSDDRAVPLPQFGDNDLSVPSAANRAMSQRMVERQVDLKRQADEAMSPLEKLAGGIQTGRLIGSGMLNAAKSIPTAITKGGKAAEDYIAENIYKPNQPKAYEYAEDVGNFLSRLETDYKIPPIIPEAMMLQNVIGPATRQAGRAAQRGARQGALNLAAPRTLDPQAGVIKFKGGNWLGGSIEKALEDLKRPDRMTGGRKDPSESLAEMKARYTPEAIAELPPELRGTVAAGMQDLERKVALNNWVDSNLYGYIKNDMATPQDPVRLMIERRMVEINQKFAKDMGRASRIEQRAAAEEDPRRKANFERQAQTAKAEAEAERDTAMKYASHMPQNEIDYATQWIPEDLALSRMRAGFPTEGLGQSNTAKGWEAITDSYINSAPASEYVKPLTESEARRGLKSVVDDNPWLSKLDPNTPVQYIKNADSIAQDLRLDHIMDVLREDVASGRIRPEQLSKVSMEQAVRRTAEYDQELAAKMSAARAAQREGLPVYKDYPEGYKWVQLNRPGDFASESEAMGHSVRGYEPPQGHPDWVEGSGDRGSLGYGVGGWEAIKSGKAKVYSLVDSKGDPHVTVEVESGKPWNERSGIFYDNPGLESSWQRFSQEASLEEKAKGLNRPSNYIERYPEWLKANEPETYAKYAKVFEEDPPKVRQIKGKGNERPVERYDPFTQDFVKSGQWSDVRDLENTGLFRLGGNEYMTEAEAAAKYQPMAQEALNFLETHPSMEQHRVADRAFNQFRGDVYSPEYKEIDSAAGRAVSQNVPYTYRELRALLSSPEDFTDRNGTIYEPISTAIEKLNQAKRELGIDLPPQEGMAHGGRVHFSDNPDVMQLELAGGGLVKRLAKAPKAAAKPVKAAQEILPAAEREENLQKFLGNSRIRERLYHATPKDFKQFKPGGDDPTMSGPAIWLTPDATKQPAAHNIGSRTQEFREGVNVMPVHVQARSPLMLDDKLSIEWARDVFADGSREFPDLISPKTIEELKKEGYDSIIHADPYGNRDGEQEIIMFEPNKIKSAIGNRGTFDIEDPDITKAAGGAVQMAGGGALARLAKVAKAAKEAAVPLSVPRVRPTTKDIMEAAERVGKQQAGEFVKSPLTTKTSNLAGRSKKEVDRLKELEYKVTPIKDLPEMKPYEAKIGEVNIALPGDQTISDMLLESVDGIPIGTTSEGGALFGRGRLSDPEETRAFWASNIGPADMFQKKVTELAQLYDTDMVTAYHLAMGQMSNNFAQHMADASIRAIDYSKLNKDKMNAFDKVVSQGYVDPTTKERITFENWPGIADPEGSLQAMKEDPKLRKWFNNRMKTEKVTKPLDLPNAKSIEWAMTEPELRNMEINLTGLSAGRMKPGAELIPDSAHQTYSHDIPGTALGRAPELSPFSISFPDATAFVREKYRPQDFTGTIQKVFPHQVVDEAYLDDMYKYYTQLRKVRGFNEGGAVRKYADGGEITADDLILEERKL